MKTSLKSLAALRSATTAEAYARPSPKVSRMKKATVFTREERAAFLASRPDLASKS